MILLAEPQNRRSPACSRLVASAVFPRQPMPGSFGPEARPSSKHRASVCQNRYPTPSRGSGPQHRVRPSLSRAFWQCPADIWAGVENSLAIAAVPVVPALRVCANDPEGGRQTCRKNYHSYSSPRCLGLAPATKAAILNVHYCSGLSAVRWARLSKTVSALPVRRLALPAGH